MLSLEEGRQVVGKGYKLEEIDEFGPEIIVKIETLSGGRMENNKM